MTPATTPAGFDTALQSFRINQNNFEANRLKSQSPEKIREAAEDFEAMFLSEMFNHMFSGLDVDPMFGGGHGEEMFRSMMVQEYGKIMARSHNGIGLADHIQKAMLDIQQNLQQGG